MLNFGWWRDKDNREGAKSIVDVLKVVVPALVIAGGAAWGVFHATGGNGPATTTPSTVIQDNEIKAGDGANINIGGTQQVGAQ